MSTEFKPQFVPDVQEFEPPPAGFKAAPSRAIESFRLGITVFALLSAITILGTAGDNLFVYNTTHLPGEYLLPLWPSDFDIRPSVALVACSATIVFLSIVSLVASKVSAVRKRAMIHNPISLLVPIICLIAALIGTSFFYGVNSSTSAHSLQSWTCQWSSISMDVKPHWGTLCRQSKVALYLMIILIPVEILALGAATYGALGNKEAKVSRQRKGSPALS